jgi:hypothetical protein
MSKASWLRFLVVALVLIGVGTGIGPAAAVVRAADLEKLDTSLKLIPADAAFYTSSLRNREQFEMFLQSNAFAKLKALPITQMGLQMFQMQAANPESEVSQALQVLKNPEVKKVVDLAADMFSNEVFLYGDESCVDFLDLLMEVNSTTSYGPLMLKAQGDNEELRPEQLQAKAVLSVVLENIEVVAVPNMLMGFKLDRPAAANEALIKLEMFLNMGLSMAPPQFQGCLKRETIAGHEYLVLRLNGKMIPWDGSEKEELGKLGIDEEDATSLIDHVKEMNLVIAFGVRENYLLASIGSSAECVEKLGVGDKLESLQPFNALAKFADRKLTSVSYVSAELMQVVGSQGRVLDQLYSALEAFISRADLGEEKTERILGDAQLFVEDVKAMFPQMGAELAFSFLGDQGVETYDYKWGEHPQIDGSKPLSLLEHVGGNPIFGIVSRGKVDVTDYEMITKWLSVGWKYFNEYAVPQMKDDEREKFAAYAKDLMPLVERLDKATRESMIPALADGQSALVFDGKFESKQIQAQVPAWEKAMPFPELALVIGVSDAELLKKGLREYKAIVQEVLAVIEKNDHEAFQQLTSELRKKSAEAGSQFNLPEIAVTEGSGYKIYGVQLPTELGLDKSFIPNAGLSDHVAVLSLSVKHSERLLEKTPLTIGGVLAKTDRPLAAAVWFNWAGLLDTATPWIDFGLEQVDEAHLGGDRASAVDQIHVLLEVLKCYRCLTVESYIEEDCLVTHSLLEIRDVPK